ncbi:hypothetical protein GGR35_003714 [Mucilaginibacter phyllosphaerae]|uniref:Uncharacterized protein n=1 Tax=Mucilaginibacter phyllosphaerae TaxID=1812349 RepID=A0ABR6IDE1_9SPHI|nr:hypothetical protein [Mucilaginibacter phyllosphaerae]
MDDYNFGRNDNYRVAFIVDLVKRNCVGTNLPPLSNYYLLQAALK